MKLFAIRFCQRIGDRLAAAKARMDGMCWYSCDLSPLCYRHALSPQRKNAAFSSVSGLFLSAGPAAVLRRVAFLIVDAVNRMLRGGTPTHIFKERLEGISPALTHRNAAAAVSAVAAIVLIVTTLNHTNPNPILGAFVHPVFDPKAAAASSMSTVQIPRINGRDISAAATAQPSAALEFPSYRLQRQKLSELLLGEIAKRHHAMILEEQEELLWQKSKRTLSAERSLSSAQS